MASPTAILRKMLQISRAVPGTERKRIRLKAPITATPVPRLPFTSIMTICTMAGSRARVVEKALGGGVAEGVGGGDDRSQRQGTEGAKQIGEKGKGIPGDGSGQYAGKPLFKHSKFPPYG